jgi:ribonuclease HI
MRPQEKVNWWQEGMLSRVEAEVSYEAWISATDSPKDDHSAGISACAWEVRSMSEDRIPVYVDAKISESEESDEQRGYVAAALGVIASLTKSAVTIYSTNQYVIDGLNRDARKWRKAGWTAPGGKQRKNFELWKLILDIADQRGTTIYGVRRTRANDPILDLVHKRAIAALDAKIQCP